MGEHGFLEDNARSRREFERRMKQLRAGRQDPVMIQRDWKIGAEDFCDWLADKLSRYGREGKRARERSETDAVLAEPMVVEALKCVQWREIDLVLQPKGHPIKRGLPSNYVLRHR